MDQEKIGKFIAECRRKKKITQSQLAETLGVTDRSISKWENGHCMPDVSLFKPLCQELDITINELLSGEKIKKEEYQEKFEDNIIKFVDKVKKEDKKASDAKLFVMILIIIISLFIAYVIGLNIYNHIKEDIHYDSRIMNCHFEKDKLIYEINGLSIVDTDYVVRELNGSKLYFITTKVELKDEERKNYETWENMAELLNDNDPNFATQLQLDINSNDSIRVYHTETSLKKIKRASSEELTDIIMDSNLVCRNK